MKTGQAQSGKISLRISLMKLYLLPAALALVVLIIYVRHTMLYWVERILISIKP